MNSGSRAPSNGNHVRSDQEPAARRNAELFDQESDPEGRIGYGAYARYSPAVLGLLIVAVVAIIGWREWRPDDDLPRAGQLVDQPAPHFSLSLFDGRTVSLDEFAGRAVALNFWASWCAPCRTEMPAFERIHQEVAASGEPSVILGVGIKNDYGQNAIDLVEALGVTYLLGRDTGGDNPVRGLVEAAYGITTYPATVFIRPDGTVFAVRFGEIDAAEIRDYLDGALGHV